MNNEILNFLDKNIELGCELSILTSKLTIRSIAKLIPYLEKCKIIKIILTDNSFNDDHENTRAYEIDKKETEMLTNEFELKLKNDLLDYSLSIQAKNIIEEKIKFKYNSKVTNSFINVNNQGKNITLINTFEISMSSLGLAENDMFFNFMSIENDQFYNHFEQIWNSTNNENKVKEKIIQKIESIYENKSPKEIYTFSLSRIFQNRLSEFDRDTKKLINFKDTKIFNKLYEFQKHSVYSIIDRINKYNGCILADSVGLGKTFEALAVIKYFELQNKSILVLTPKKLSQNWKEFNNSYITNFLIEDGFHYKVYNHTDLSRNSNEFKKMDWSNFDLVVIDESHNFRNGKFNHEQNKYNSVRYEKLMNEVVLKGKNTSILLLSATPINNQISDIANQINLITKNNDEAFKEYGINSIKNICIYAEKQSNKWIELDDNQRTISKYEQMVGVEFRKLIDLITIARSRKQIKMTYSNLDIDFPNRKKPISKKPNIDLNNSNLNINELNNKIRNIIFSVYKPSHYIKPQFVKKYEEELNWKKNDNNQLKQSDRENNIVNLMTTNILKRFESSIESFRLTINKILDSTRKRLINLESFEQQNYLSMENMDEDFDDEELENSLTINKEVKIKMPHIDIFKYKSDLWSDIEKFNEILNEYESINYQSDGKLQELIEVINNKIKNPFNENNRKIIIFTSFADTAEYIYKNISLVFSNQNIYTLLITGQENKTNHPLLKDKRNEFNELLTYFSPKSKDLKHSCLNENIDNLDILVATDCISEGQNLQDCDCIINYDVHWNPVRLIQRFGRIDRIGSTNKDIQMITFWPNIELDEYIKLESKIYKKMAKVSSASSSDSDILNMIDKDRIINQLKQLQQEILDLEDINF